MDGASRAPQGDRRRYRQDVETLLEQIRRTVHELHLLRAHGVRAPALAERKHDLGRTRRQLAALVDHRSYAAREHAPQLVPHR